MRLIVCGGRTFTNKQVAFKVLDEIHKSRTITHIIEGGANGADRLARDWAILYRIPYTTVNAQWDLHGRAAGYKRNYIMATEHNPDEVLALPGGVGTQMMIDIAHKLNIKTRVI